MKGGVTLRGRAAATAAAGSVAASPVGLRLPGWSTTSAALAALGGTAVLAVLARLPFVGAALGPDEGGYAYVAREWARGVPLYDGIWIDRPQGLVSVYRSVLAIADHPWAIRLAALLAGVAITLLVGAVAWSLCSRAAGVAAAAIYAVAGTGPHIEGFTLNGELLAALPSTAAVLAAIAWWRRGGLRWLVAAGVLGGTGITMKQGGFDGLGACLALVLAAAPGWPARARAAAALVAGALVPVGAALIHALTVGFGTYWTDIVAFRATSQFHDGSRSYFFESSFPRARQDVLALAVVALVGVLAVVRRRTARVVLLAWLGAGLVAFNVGGLFWAHYYVQLLPVLAVLAGIGATAFGSRPLTAVLVGAAVAPTAVSLVAIVSGHEGVRYSKLQRVDRAVADFVRVHTAPSDTIYALDSRAELYYLADRRTRYPYLWHHSPLLTPRGRALLRRELTGPERPRIVVVYRDPRHFDHSGATSVALHVGYKLVWNPRAGVRVYMRRPGPRRPRALKPLSRL